MKKSSVQEIKKRNQRMIIQTILEHGSGLSRIELSQKTDLSPSTISSLVVDLLEKNILAENGVRVSTAGRSRTELCVNSEYGVIAVIEITRVQSLFKIFDMALNEIQTLPLENMNLSGNDVLVTITKELFNCLGEEKMRAGYLKGIGLLFQEDIQSSDFSVMYSTGFSAATISLKDAIITQFKVPVIEDYLQTYTVSQAVSNEAAVAQNSVHVSVGSHIIVSNLTLGGKSVLLKNGNYASLTTVLDGTTKLIGQEENTEILVNSNASTAQPCVQSLAMQTAMIIALLNNLFSLDTIFLTGKAIQNSALLQRTNEILKLHKGDEKLPDIKILDEAKENCACGQMASHIRGKVLCS